MDEQRLGLPVLRLVALRLVDCLVETHAAELDDDEADVHGELEEDQADRLSHKLVLCRAQINGERAEQSKTKNDEC